MPATNKTFSLDEDVISALKEKADHLCVSMSELVCASVAHAVALPDDELIAKVREYRKDGVKASEGRAGAKVERALSRFERSAMHGIERLLQKYAEIEPFDLRHGNNCFPLKEIAKAGGLYPTEALKGLRALEERKLVRCIMSRPIDAIVGGLQSIPEIEHWAKRVLPR